MDLEGDSDSDDDDDDFVVELVEEEPKPSAKKQKKATTSAPPAAQAPIVTSPPKKPSVKKAPVGPKGPLAALANNPEALAAVAAVDAAAASLPPEEELGMTLLSEAVGGRAPDEPVNRGTKELPVGHPDCLTGKTFVISGVLDSLTRPEAEDLIKRHGGKVTGAVSSRTSFLIVGQYTGRGKYRDAKEKKIPLINEDGLFSLIKAAPAPEAPAIVEPAAALAGPSNGAGPSIPTGGAPPASKPSGAFYGGASGSGSAAAPEPVKAPRPPSALSDNQLWVEKWRPKSSAELVGNTTLVATLRQWLRDWDRVHLHGGEPSLPPGSRKDRAAEMKKKAVIMSGSPGIGKTSAALIICRELGYEPIEVNASDARSKADASVLKGVGGKLANSIKELSTNAAVSYDDRCHRKKVST